MTDYMLLPPDHHLQFTTCLTSPAKKRSPLTVATTTAMGGKQRIQHASLSVMLDAAFVVVYFTTIHKMTQLIIMPSAH